MPNDKTGIMLLNLGGPDTLHAVRPFLYNLFSDREIIRLGPAPLQKPIAWLISTTRAPKTRRYYSLIGGGSPILKITMAQAQALEQLLPGRKVYVGMRYWKPFIEDVVRRAHDEGVTRLIALSLYPHYSKATSGSSEAEFVKAANRYGISYGIIPPFYNHPGYVDALVETIRNGLKKFDRPPVLLYSAHSLPVSFIEEGDPYVEHIMATIKAVEEKIDIKWRLGYQSRSGPVKWLEPSTEDVLKQLAEEGVRDTLMVPISFVSDHIETLYEIDILYRGMAEGLGLRVERTEALNTNPAFIEALKDMVFKSI